MSITKISDQKFRARYRTPDGASRSKTFTRRVDAEQFLASVTVSVAQGSYVDARDGRVTFKDYRAVDRCAASQGDHGGVRRVDHAGSCVPDVRASASGVDPHKRSAGVDLGA